MMDKMIMSFNLLLLLIIFSDDVCCDKSTNPIKSKIQEAFKNSSKVWHNYVRMFFQRYLRWDQSLYKSFIMNSFKISKYSLIFLQLKDKSLESSGYYKTNEFDIKWPSGHIHIIINTHYLHFDGYNYDYYFTLNSQLRLNITFNVLTIPNYDEMYIQNTVLFMPYYNYSGKYSKFNVYPKFSKLIMYLILQSQNAFKLDATFSIIDKNLIFSPINLPSRITHTLRSSLSVIKLETNII